MDFRWSQEKGLVTPPWANKGCSFPRTDAAASNSSSRQAAETGNSGLRRGAAESGHTETGGDQRGDAATRNNNTTTQCLTASRTWGPPPGGAATTSELAAEGCWSARSFDLALEKIGMALAFLRDLFPGLKIAHGWTLAPEKHQMYAER